MLKQAAIFAAGALAVLIVLAAYVGYSVLSARRTVKNGLTLAPDPVTTVLTIHVTENPLDLVSVNNAAQLIDRISGLSPEQKKRIRDAIETGLITSIHLESKIGNEVTWMDVSPDKPNLTMQGSIKMDPLKFTIGPPKRLSQPKERNARADQ